MKLVSRSNKIKRQNDTEDWGYDIDFDDNASGGSHDKDRSAYADRSYDKDRSAYADRSHDQDRDAYADRSYDKDRSAYADRSHDQDRSAYAGRSYNKNRSAYADRSYDENRGAYADRSYDENRGAYADRNYVENRSVYADRNHIENPGVHADRSYDENWSAYPDRNNGAHRRTSLNNDHSERRINGGSAGDSEVKSTSNKKNRVRAAVIILLIIAVGFVALFLSLGFYVRSLDTVFPNVWVEGINVSGKTLEEATQALINEGYEKNAESISVTIIFPDDSFFSVSGEQVGLSLNAREAAMVAFSFGREESFLSNNLTYIKSRSNRTDLNDLGSASFDGSILRKLAADYTAQFNETLFDNNLEINEDNITIVKGTGLQPADEVEVYKLAINTLNNAVEENEHKTATYVPEATLDDGIDLQMLFGHIHVEPVDSRYEVETLSATPSSEGRTFDLERAQEMLKSATNGSIVVIPIIVLEPEVTKEDIESMLFRDVLAESTTNIAGTSNRLNNITIAAGFMNETIVNPDQVFSFNQVVGERTSARGFLMAGVYIGGRLQDGIGGGICQASSTLYDAILHTHLEVVERTAHGFIVTYLPYGNDATVFFGRLDFKFKNNTDYPIRIESTVNGRELKIKLIGTKLDDTYIKIETVPISTTPFSVEEREDPELPLGHTEVYTPGITGHVVDTYKVVYSAEDVEIDRILVGRTTYRVQHRVILHGTYVDPNAPPPYDSPPEEHPPVEGG